ncbi:MAG: WecB/TagA/CpsF family glycosyltransferase [Muribaculaceae bacterium]|nr:WecB/TagA/CpsF family glycosyltransferase [Muribaculaceae bacterium]
MNNRHYVETIRDSASGYPEVTFRESGKIYTCVNPYSYHLIRKNPDLYSEMDGLFVDGMLMCKMIGLLWGYRIRRLSFDMSGMAVDLFGRINKSRETIYFIGTTQEALEMSLKNIKNQYPSINVAGYRNGYFSNPADRKSEIERIVNLNPDFVIVGMGSPLQEKFCIDLKKAGYKGIAFTCGGFLHQTSSGIQYYPDWINRYNLRAFYRLTHEKGLWKRLYNVLIEFPILFTWDSLMTKMRKKR